MQIAPETDIILLKTPFEMNDSNQLTFSNATNQFNFFNSLPKLELHDATYQRKDEVVRWAGRFDDIISYNYCMYRNTSYSNKWFYAYIDDLKYINDNMTEIKLKNDVFQSWQFDIIYKRSFIEREHVNDDTIGIHTIDEGLETGDYVCNFTDDVQVYGNLGVGYCCLCSDFPPLLTQYFARSVYNGVFSGAKAIVFFDVDSASAFVQYMENQAMSKAIVSFFMIPLTLVEYTIFTRELDFDPSIFGVDKKEITFGRVDETEGSTFMGNFSLNNITTLNGYTPKNNKLFTGKYNYLYFSNNSGANVEYHYEDFINNTPQFEVIGAFGVGCSIQLLPQNYLKFDTEQKPYGFYNYGITCGKFPVCSWNSDSYTAWLSENSLNLAIGVGESLVTPILGSIGSLGDNPLSLRDMGGAVRGVTNVLKEKLIHATIPNQAKGNTNLGELQFSTDKTCFTFYQMSVRYEYAKLIDDYFQAYGYKVNEYKLPNITGRRNWNYVKTIDINILGDIPQKDLEELRNIFDNGVTLWHNPNTFLDYSQDNSII